MVDGFCDFVIRGYLVDLVIFEFVLIINVGYWLCFSIIGVLYFGIVRVFDSLFIKLNVIVVEYVC